MNNQTRIVFLWFMLIVCMILHFDYHVSDIFYGISVEKPGANGIVPPTIIIIRLAFHTLPFAFALINFINLSEYESL